MQITEDAGLHLETELFNVYSGCRLEDPFHLVRGCSD